MKQYLELVNKVLKEGIKSDDRTGTGTLSIFGTQTRYNLEHSFPLLTTKKIYFSSVVKELLWILSGSTNVNDLDSKIWDPWADEDGDLGPIYGSQWRDFGGTRPARKSSSFHPGILRHADGIDQITQVIESIKNNPYSRRHIVTAWNPSVLEWMALPPCHLMFQFYVRNGKLSCHMYQRSADLMIGVPFNIASYSLLTYLIANEVGLRPHEFIHTIGDCHIYLNHLSGAATQLSRTPTQPPQVIITEGKPVLEIQESDIQLIGYKHQGFIKFPIAV